jgi:flagellar FliL protein
MSTAAVADAPKGGKKKLIIIIAAAAVLLLGGGGTALVLIKKKAADAEAAAAAEEDGDAPAHKPAKAASFDPKHVPTFVPLDAFTVNLADRDAERYAQVGITLEIGDPQTADRIKAFMPAIRNNILLALSDRTAAELMGRDGKAKLAEKVKRETSKALGVEVDDEEAADGEEEAPPPKASKSKKKKKKRVEPELPIKAVHFSTFIIQ